MNILDSYIPDAGSFPGIAQQLDKGKPVVAGLSTKSGTMQVVIHGYDSANAADPKITVTDADSKTYTVTFSGFPENYSAGSTWEKTYYTRRG